VRTSDPTGTPPSASTVQTLRAAVNGPVHRAGEHSYDTARLGWRRTIDPYPALVVEAANAQDVQAAVRFARDRALPLAVQATGHGTISSCDGGLLLKTTRMATVQIHADRHTARVGGGAVWGAVVAAAAPSGLAPLSGTAASVGVTGSTLGGGVGWLSRRYGFAADSLLAARIVTADGQLLTASPKEHPELFWALRGGGGNFGVVTALTFRLYPVDRVYGGTVVFNMDCAEKALACYRDWALTEPDASGTVVMLRRLPAGPHHPGVPRGQRLLALRVLYVGEAEDAERLLAPLRAAAGPPLVDGLGPMRFADTATIFGPPPAPAATHTRIELFRQLPDAVIEASITTDEADPGPVGSVGSIEVRHWGGAMARPGQGAGPIGHRDAPFSVIVVATVDDQRGSATASDAVEAVAARLRPHATGGSFLNFLTEPTKTPTAYTPQDYQRLAAVKKTYDPDNVFGANHNIPPAA